jgi:hypothetical protein
LARDEKEVAKPFMGDLRKKPVRGSKMKQCGMTRLLQTVALIILVPVVVLTPVEPTHSALRSFAYMGTLIGRDPQNNTIEIQTEFVWGSGGWESYKQALVGVAPNENAVTDMGVGDYLIGVSLGIPGESWITLGKMISPTNLIITDIYGDPAYVLDLPLLGDYAITYSNTPDCAACNGCNCDAEYTAVTITVQGSDSDAHELYPDETYSYQDAQHRMNITFLSGQAPSYPECSDTPCFGPQAVSNFAIHINGDLEALTRGSEDGDGGDSCFIRTATRSINRQK